MSLRILTALGALAGLGLYTLSLLPDLPADPDDVAEPVVATSQFAPSDNELHLLVYREPGHYEWVVIPPPPSESPVRTAVARTPVEFPNSDSLTSNTPNRKPLNQEVSL